MNLPKLISICGPTASGKTGLGIEIAQRFNGEVISVDSRQIYREMNIGTAKVAGDPIETGGTLRQMIEGAKPVIVEGVSHWGIDLVDPDTDYSVAEFKEYAEKKIAEIVRRGHVPILVGGTGLWLHALIDNYDLTQTPADPVLRAELEQKTVGDLFAELKRIDPEGAEIIDRDNKRRLVRAVEVTRLTGKPFSQQQTKGIPKYDVLQIGLSVDREVLNERINTRVDEMIANGLVNEVRALEKKYGSKIDSMSGIGYRQICWFFEGKMSLVSAIQEIKQATRQYAKRQMTWFKRDSRIQWVQSKEEVTPLVDKFIH
ncbi:MAG: tRNA (adenosine(37)-N6)-dimethylallyltransferase MiaA [Patescibacteria group bacterium]